MVALFYSACGGLPSKFPRLRPHAGAKGDRMLFFWSAWFAAGLILVLVLAGTLIPYLWMRAYAALHPVRDRGVSVGSTKVSCSVAYETAEPVSPIMGRYVLTRGIGLNETNFVGEWQNPVAAAEFGLVAYGKNGVPCGVLRIREPGDSFRRFTHPVTLPEETAYVSVAYCRTRANSARCSERSLTFWIWACLLSLAAAAAAGILIGCSMRFAEAVAFEALGYTSVLPVGGAVAAVVSLMAGIPLLAGAADLYARPYLRRALAWLKSRTDGVRGRYQLFRKRVRAGSRKTAFFLRTRFCALQNMLAGGGAPKPPREDDAAEGGEQP